MIRDTSAQDTVVSSRGPHRKMLAWLTGSVVVIGVTLAWVMPSLASLYSSDMTLSRSEVRLSTVTRGALKQDIMAQGRIIAAISPTFYAPAEGEVSLLVRAGDQVKRGQPLVSIHSPSINSLLSQEQAGLESLQLDMERAAIDNKESLLALHQNTEIARVDLSAANKEMQRANLSREGSLISDVEYQQIVVALDKAKLTHSHAEQTAKLAEERLAFEQRSRHKALSRQQEVVRELERQVSELTIHAPFDGVIGNVVAQDKQAVIRNAPLLSAVNMQAFEIEAQIPEIYADELGIGMQVEVPLEQRTELASLTAISPEVVNGQVAARIRFAELPAGLRQNQRVNVRVLISSHNDVLKVQRGAFLESRGGRVAFVVRDNVATRTEIETGARSSGEVQIVNGLNRGDTIIVSSLDRFAEQQTLFLTE